MGPSASEDGTKARSKTRAETKGCCVIVALVGEFSVLRLCFFGDDDVSIAVVLYGLHCRYFVSDGKDC